MPARHAATVTRMMVFVMKNYKNPENQESHFTGLLSHPLVPPPLCSPQTIARSGGPMSHRVLLHHDSSRLLLAAGMQLIPPPLASSVDAPEGLQIVGSRIAAAV
mmetsp:Transcript_136432/g.236712  ORF Transcript_136432/g.236712 Transcript_136432/m.236712 type:complete len:104 (+) Transcript_136432:1715-2026(+)